MTNNILPSWNDTEIKRSILKFIERISNKDSEDFIPEENRIAVFDNDGTLWTEQPFPVQLLFALDRVKELAELNPEMKNSQPFQG